MDHLGNWHLRVCEIWCSLIECKVTVGPWSSICYLLRFFVSCFQIVGIVPFVLPDTMNLSSWLCLIILFLIPGIGTPHNADPAHMVQGCVLMVLFNRRRYRIFRTTHHQCGDETFVCRHLWNNYHEYTMNDFEESYSVALAHFSPRSLNVFTFLWCHLVIMVPHYASACKGEQVWEKVFFYFNYNTRE